MKQRLIKVDGKVRTDITYPAGFMGESIYCVNSFIVVFLVPNSKVPKVRPWILFPYKSLKSEIVITLKLLLLTLKLQEVANFGVFFHLMQTIHLIHVCVQ